MRVEEDEVLVVEEVGEDVGADVTLLKLLEIELDVAVVLVDDAGV